MKPNTPATKTTTPSSYKVEVTTQYESDANSIKDLLSHHGFKATVVKVA